MTTESPRITGFARLLPVYLAESAWSYLVLLIILATASPEARVGPTAVLVPFGAALLANLLAGCSRTCPLARSRMANRMPSLVAALLLTLWNLLLGAACIVGVLWWELYAQLPLSDPGWLDLAIRQARGAEGALPLGVWLLGFGLLAWWRGTRLAWDGSGTASPMPRFLWATAILLVLAGLAAPLPLDRREISWTVAAYLLFSLVSVAASRLEQAARGRLGGVDGGWQWRSSALALLLVGLGFAVLLLLPWLSELADSLRHWLFDVLLPLAVYGLKWLIHLLGLDQAPQAPLLEGGAGGPGVRAPEQSFSLPEGVRQAGRLLFNLSWIALLLYALFLQIRRWRSERRQGLGPTSVRESIPWSIKRLFREILAAVLRALVARWPSLSGWLRVLPPEERALTVRELYRGLLAWAARRGCDRKPWTTPAEYEAQLSARWPALSEELMSLTGCYVRSRYGGLDLEEKEVAVAVEGWRRIVSQG